MATVSTARSRGGAEKPDRSRSRCPARVRTGQGRGVEDHRQPAGAVRLRLARRQQCRAGAGRRPCRRKRRQATIKADYELVQQIGTQRAWEVFLALIRPASMPTWRARRSKRWQPAAKSAAAERQPRRRRRQRRTPNRDAPPKGSDRVGQGEGQHRSRRRLQKFIKRFPDSPLAINAQQRIDVLKKAAQEREDKARAERKPGRGRGAVSGRTEESRTRRAKKRDEDERRAREAEAAQEGQGCGGRSRRRKKTRRR